MKNKDTGKKNKYTRDVSSTMMHELTSKDGRFRPFVEYVKRRKDLALCFRGNDSEIGKVIIYKHNHAMWNLYFKVDKSDGVSETVPEVSINLDHARFTSNWYDVFVKRFMDMGFKRRIDKSEIKSFEKNDKRVFVESFEELDKREFVKRSKSNGSYSYSAGELIYRPDDLNATREMIRKSYVLLNAMFESFFSTDSPEVSVEENSKGKVVCTKHPVNYIKKFYFENHTAEETAVDHAGMGATFQKCVEKHVQQELFLLNHEQRDGIFIYDLEFAQPHVDGYNVSKNNKPDMFGLRFEKGKMVSICMVEVKSTQSALGGTSGLTDHLKGMKEYLEAVRLSKSGERILLMQDRKEEACRILEQYRQLGLYGVDKVYKRGQLKEEDFLHLDTEIICAFTNELDLDHQITYEDPDNKKKTGPIRQALADYGFEPDSVLKSGDYAEHLEMMTYRMPRK